MVLSQIFPSLARTYEIKRVVTTSTELIVEAHSCRCRAVCPSCGQESSRVHSYYQRRLWEQPCVGRPVQLLLTVHRFRCVNALCRRSTFAEPLDELAVRYAQRTRGQELAVQNVGLALGGQAGAPHARRLGLRGASPTTLLRAARRAALPLPAEPRVVGVDDWAWRRGQRYGTILVDLERGRPVDLLAEYSAEAITAWLREHRQIRVVVRDRSKVGIQAARQGAPQAVQVADRFHLLKNLTDQVAAGFERHPRSGERHSPSPAAQPPTADPPSQLDHPQSSKQQCYRQMQALQAAGWSLRAIAQQVGRSRSTVHRWLLHGCPAADWGHTVRHRASRGARPPSSEPLPSSRSAAWWFVCRPQALPQRQREPLAQLLAKRPELAPIYQLAQRFVRLIGERDVAALPGWLQEAKQCAWSQLRELARGLERDLSAVQAALTLPWSNDGVAYCTPSAWLACVVRRVWSLCVGWRKQGNPTAIGLIHGNATSSPPSPDRLWADSIGVCGFTG